MSISVLGIYLYVTPYANIYFTGKSTDELLGTWQREANFALGARQKGVHLELFKNVGERKVYSLFCFWLLFKIYMYIYNLDLHCTVWLILNQLIPWSARHFFGQLNP